MLLSEDKRGQFNAIGASSPEDLLKMVAGSSDAEFFNLYTLIAAMAIEAK